VVCTRDRADRLEGCLAALAEQRYPSYEVVVVDNAPQDDTTRRVAEHWSVRYVREPRPGLDWARNRGLAAARTPIVAFTDDDAQPEPGWLAALVRGFASPDVAVVTGLVLPAELETPAQLLFEDAYGGMGKGFAMHVHTHRSRRPVFRPEWVGAGCNMAFRRTALLEIGGFDPALDVGTATGGGGDLDVFQRLLEAGSAIAYRPDAVVRHLHRSTMAALRRQLFDNGRSYSAMLTAAFLRARGWERWRVVDRYLRWIVRWHAWRLVRGVAGREALPLRLVVAEAAGAPLGPLLYWRARRTAHRLAAGDSDPSAT
ncbi:MAG: glycosyltransferase family 2 protein, partial [Gaiellaceae bacterium]